jgi:16S rRNA (guanine966-N2)-methyltransferase
MRVIAGTARGRRIEAPSGLSVRPTSDRVRQATFNALSHRNALGGAEVVDLFAGSGALGIEALSRGAAHATFVENDRTAQRFIQSNLDTLGFADRATIVRGDATRWVGSNRQQFDLVFADPPYTFDGWVTLLAELLATAMSGANDDGERLCVMETHHVLDVGVGWDVLRQQRYGGTVVTLAAPAEAIRSDLRSHFPPNLPPTAESP